MKKTKIVCTMGPNTDNREIMRELALNGMDVARFNFSHGDHAEHKHRLEILESVREELGIPIASLLDTKGPEIRTGKLKDGKKVTLKEGDLYTLTTEEIVGDETRGYINYAGLAEDVKPGDSGTAVSDTRASIFPFSKNRSVRLPLRICSRRRSRLHSQLPGPR